MVSIAKGLSVSASSADNVADGDEALGNGADRTVDTGKGHRDLRQTRSEKGTTCRERYGPDLSAFTSADHLH